MTYYVQYGQTALSWAAREGYANVIQVFIDCGTAVDIRDKVTDN